MAAVAKKNGKVNAKEYQVRSRGPMQRALACGA
jgi:hypothetical protein